MGAFTTVRSYAVSSAPITTTGEEAITASTTPDNSKLKTVATLIGEIAEYIPAEGLVTYLSAYAIVVNAQGGGPEIAAIASLVVGVIAVLLFGLFSIFSIDKSMVVNRKRAAWGLVVSVVMLGIYVSLLPASVFTQLVGLYTWIPALIALVVTIALGLWGDRLIIFGKKTPTT